MPAHQPPESGGGVDPSAGAEFRKHLQTCEAKGWERFDDTAFKMAAGGLALSLTLAGVTKNLQPASMYWVFGAWVCWSVSLLVILISIWTGQQGLRSQIAHRDTGDYYTTKHAAGVFGRVTPALNLVAIATCGGGLVCIVLFTLKNL